MQSLIDSVAAHAIPNVKSMTRFSLHFIASILVQRTARESERARKEGNEIRRDATDC
jgi:hypothetical protein